MTPKVTVNDGQKLTLHDGKGQDKNEKLHKTENFPKVYKISYKILDNILNISIS